MKLTRKQIREGLDTVPIDSILGKDVTRELTAKQKVERAHVQMMGHPATMLFSGVFMVGSTEVTSKVPTACTNGRDTWYGEEFISKLSAAELNGVILHENLHKVYQHHWLWKHLWDDDKRLANMSADYVINLEIADLAKDNRDFIQLPEGVLLDERFRGMDAKQVYDILEKENKEKQRGDGGQGDGEKTDGMSDSSGGQGGLDDHDWEGAQKLTADEQKQLAQDIEGALRQGGIYAGKVGGDMLRTVKEMIEPKVDWRDALRRFIRVSLKDRDQPSWRRAHRNYLWQDVILPSIMGKRMKHLVVAFDTSGSIQGEMLSLFMGELNKVIEQVNPDRIDVLYWDTEVAGHETYKGNDKRDLVHKTKPRGGGGTDPDCLPPYIAQKGLNPDAFIVLTDGYMSSDASKWAAISKPILWCIIGNKQFGIPRGQLVNVND